MLGVRACGTLVTKAPHDEEMLQEMQSFVCKNLLAELKGVFDLAL